MKKPQQKRSSNSQKQHYSSWYLLWWVWAPGSLHDLLQALSNEKHLSGGPVYGTLHTLVYEWDTFFLSIRSASCFWKCLSLSCLSRSACSLCRDSSSSFCSTDISKWVEECWWDSLGKLKNATGLTCFWSLAACSLSLWHLSSSCLLSSSSLIFLISSASRRTSSSLFARSSALRRAISSLANLGSKKQEEFGPSCCLGISCVDPLSSKHTSPAAPAACVPPPPSPSARGPAGGSQPGFGSPPLGLWCLLRACGAEDWLQALKRKASKF